MVPQKFTLDNGLTLILKEDHSAPVVSAQIWVRNTGSIYEAEHLGSGLSHMLEHMLFKGTTTRQPAQIAQEVEARGGYINAYTSFERTVYYINIPSDGGDPGTSHGVETALDILMDAVVHSTLPEDEFIREKDVIFREMAMGRDNPDRRASQILWSTAYAVHPYQYPIIGYNDLFGSLNREKVNQFYHQRYIPNNFMVVVVGSFKTQAVRAQVERYLGKLPRLPMPSLFIPDEPPQVSKREQHEEMNAELSRIHMAFQTINFRDTDSEPLDVLAIIAGYGQSSRLNQVLREHRGIVHEIDAWSHTPQFTGMFGISAIVDSEKREAAVQAVLDELKRFQDETVKPEELKKAIKQVVANQLSSAKTMQGQANDLGSNEYMTGDLQFSNQYLERVRKVTAQDIQRVAQKYLNENRLTTTSLNPIGTFKQSITTSFQTQSTEMEKLELSNGLRVILREDHRLPFVNFRLVGMAGVLLEDEHNNGITQLLSKLLLKGTKNRTAEQIAEQIETVGGQITSFGGNNSFGISIEVLNEDTELAVDVLADILQNSTFPDEEFKREQEIQIADIKSDNEQIMKVAINRLRSLMFSDHSYRMPTSGTEESVEKITRQDVADFAKNVVSPKNCVLSIFGNFDSNALKKLLQSRLKNWKSQNGFAPCPSPAPLAKCFRMLEHQDKEQGVVLIGYRGTSIKHQDRYALEILDTALSGMGSRLFVRVRDELGLCYYVGANQLIGLNTGMFYFYIGTNPKQTDIAEKEILAVINEIREKGLTEEELLRAKRSILGEHKIQQQNLGEQATKVALDELYGLGYQHQLQSDSIYEKISMDDVKKVARTYLNPDSFIVVTIKPEDKEKNLAA